MRRRAWWLLVGLALAVPAAAQSGHSLPDLGDTEVTLSWQDFKRLIEAAQPVPTPVAAPPRAAFLRSAEYTGRIEPGVLTLDAVLELEVLQDGWVRLPMWSQGSVVRFDGDGAVLSRDGGLLEVLARGPRSYQLRARLVFQATDHPGDNRLDLELPDAPLNLLDVTAGTGLRELEVETGVSYRALPSRVFAALINGRATLKYTVPYRAVEAETGEEVELQPRVLLTGYEFLHLGDGVIGGTLVHDYQVRVAEISSFDIGLEPGVEVFDVATPGLESWKVLQLDGGKVLRVRLGSPTEGSVRVVVTFDGTYDADRGELVVPRFEPIAVERESGFVAVAADGAELALGLTGNLLPADVSEIPADLLGFGGSLVAALKYSGTPDRATVTVTEHDDAAVLTAIVEKLNASTVLLANGTEATWLDLAVKNNRKQFLKLRLPEDGVEVWSLVVDGQPARPKRSEDRVLIPLPTGIEERTSQVSLVLLRRGDEVPAMGTIRPSLPGIDVPVSEALWTIYLPPDARYRPVEDGFRILGVTAPLFGHGAGTGVFGVAAPARTMLEEAAGYVSSELVDKQKVQQEQIQQQVMARQGAGRRGALPVRINLPGGVTSLPVVTVARILIVDDEQTALAIRIYPQWLRATLRSLQVLAIVAAGVLAALLIVGRLGRWHLRWVALIALLGLLPVGGIAIVPALVWMVVVTGAATPVALLAQRRMDRERRAAHDAEQEPSPSAE
jgi:hypothetical protein